MVTLQLWLHNTFIANYYLSFKPYTINTKMCKKYICIKSNKKYKRIINIHMQDFTYYLFIIAAIYQNILLEYVGSTDFHRLLESDMQYSGPQLLHLYKLKFFVL